MLALKIYISCMLLYFIVYVIYGHHLNRTSGHKMGDSRILTISALLALGWPLSILISCVMGLITLGMKVWDKLYSWYSKLKQHRLSKIKD